MPGNRLDPELERLLQALAERRAASRPQRQRAARASAKPSVQAAVVMAAPTERAAPIRAREQRSQVRQRLQRQKSERTTFVRAKRSRPQRGGAKVMLNQEQRRERRHNMALQVAQGKSVEDVAFVFGVTPDTVRVACKEFRAIFRLSHEERRLRRARIASAIAEGQSMDQVRETFRVSAEFVAAACREHKVLIPGRKRGRPAQIPAFQILGWLIAHPSRSQADAARHFGVTRQRIEQIARAAVAAGIPVPQRQV